MGSEINNVNVYNIFDDCINGDLDFDAREAALKFSRGARIPINPKPLGGPVGCIDGIEAGAYLNDDTVQAALHVNSKSWTICATLLYSRQIDSVIPLYPTLAQIYRTLIFNGDADACVPFTDNQDWTSSLGLPVKAPWHAWTLDNQVAGYATVYDLNNFTFVSVKGAGHMVPEYKPKQALELFHRFINNQPF